MKKARMQSIHIVLKLAQLRWTGHILRMHDERLSKEVCFLRSISGGRGGGRGVARPHQQRSSSL